MQQETGSLTARAARIAAIAILVACAAFFVARTIHWPLVGDPAATHYVAFLTEHGMAPYRDLFDINLPGAFLLDAAVMHTLGGGSLAWRVFDLLLLAAATGAMIWIAGDWLAGLLAGVVLGAIHGADGIFNMGQRDFVIAAMVLVGYAALFRATRRGAARWMVVFGLCAGAATTIKPTFLPLGPLLLAALALYWRKEVRPYGKYLAYGCAGLVAPYAGMWIYLAREHAVGAFIHVMTTMVRYHASLARRPLGYLLLHSVAPLLGLLLLWIALLAWSARTRQGRKWPGWERGALWIGVACGLLSYLAQAKGYPYQRYPLLALLLLLIAMDLLAATRKTGLARAAGWTGIAYCVLFLAPFSVWKASRYDWRDTGLIGSLDQELSALGGRSLSGQVQCIDTVGGCNTALYNLRLVQHTGFLFDEFLFGPDNVPVVAATRKAFWASLASDPPRVLIVVAGLFPSGPRGFAKLKLWPAFDGYLKTHYLLYKQVTPARGTYWWSRRDPPLSYRIYLLKPDA